MSGSMTGPQLLAKLMDLELPEASEAATRRNSIRRALLQWFSSVSVHVLGPAADTEVLGRHTSLPFDQVRPAFRKQVQGLVADIMRRLAEDGDAAGRLLGQVSVARS
jgi:hypothetical protein